LNNRTLTPSLTSTLDGIGTELPSHRNGNGSGHGKQRRRVLAIGAHPDDIELGCAGTLLAHRAQGDAVSMLVMSRGELGPQDVHSRVAEQEAASELLGAELYWGDFEDAAIPSGFAAVNVVQDVIARTEPDVIYTHTLNDSHQDHRATAMATLAAARRTCRILCYEAPSSLGFAPMLFVDISKQLDGKVRALRAHWSQVLKNGLVDIEAIEAAARYRGFQARVRLAEAFEVERFLWDLDRAVSIGSHRVVEHEKVAFGR
jgi:LmbE family N-acetylglucosaminyl deacetylase